MDEPIKKPLSEKKMAHMANMRLKAAEKRALKKIQKEEADNQKNTETNESVDIEPLEEAPEPEPLEEEAPEPLEEAPEPLLRSKLKKPQKSNKEKIAELRENKKLELEEKKLQLEELKLNNKIEQENKKIKQNTLSSTYKNSAEDENNILFAYGFRNSSNHGRRYF